MAKKGSKQAALMKLHGMKHPGFENVAEDMAEKEGVSKERASAMLASKTRKASKAAKKANPNLKKVRGG